MKEPRRAPITASNDAPLTMEQREDIIEEMMSALLMLDYKLDIWTSTATGRSVRLFKKSGHYDTEEGEIMTEVVMTPDQDKLLCRQVVRRSLLWRNEHPQVTSQYGTGYNYAGTLCEFDKNEVLNELMGVADGDQ